MDNNTMVAVTQEDREAAWPLRPKASTGAEPIDRFGWFRGDYDDDSAIQAFARHRHQSRRTGAGEALVKVSESLRLLQPALNVMAREIIDDIIADHIAPVLNTEGATLAARAETQKGPAA